MALPLKLGLLSATVISSAVMFNLLSPSISDLPIIWTSLTSWLKPPYLYVVINFIIITIVASSRLQSKIDGSDHHHHSFSTFPTQIEPVKVFHHEPEVPFHGGVLVDQPMDIAVDSELKSKFGDETLDEDIKKNIRVVDKPVISVSTWTPNLDMNQVGLLSVVPVEKPPASARFSHRKPAKGNPEGGKTLGVAKPKRQDTLETTWKAITEGRSVPLTRHLRKSDTWETHAPRRENRNSENSFTDNNHPEKMTKSETFDVNRRNAAVKPRPPPPSKLKRSGGSGRLKKEPSLGQEELNRRVEAFINKFNEDMRLQRQESLNQFMEMINRGAH